MRYDEEDVDPHQPEMPDTRYVVPSKERRQPMELHGLVNRPACSDRKQPGDWNREVCCALERVVLCVKAGMPPLAAGQFGAIPLSRIGGHLALCLKSAPVPGSEGAWDSHFYRARIDAQVWASFVLGAVLSGLVMSFAKGLALLPALAVMLLLAVYSPSRSR